MWWKFTPSCSAKTLILFRLVCLSCPVCFIKCFIKVSNKSLITFLVAQTVKGHLSLPTFSDESYKKEQSETSLGCKNNVFLPFVTQNLFLPSIPGLRFTSQWPLTSLHQMVSVLVSRRPISASIPVIYDCGWFCEWMRGEGFSLHLTKKGNRERDSSLI